MAKIKEMILGIGILSAVGVYNFIFKKKKLLSIVMKE